MEFQHEEPEILSSFTSSVGIAPSQGRFVEVVNESCVLFTSGTSLVIHDSAINKREYIRSDLTWFRILASAVNDTRQYCAVVVLTGKPTLPRVRRASVIQRRGSVFGQEPSKSAGAGGVKSSVSHIPVGIALTHLPTRQIESQVQLTKSYFFDPSTISFCSFSQDGMVICIGSSEPENKVIVVDPRTAELLFTFTNDEKMLSITFTVEKRFKQSEVYALLVMSANKLQSYKQEDKRTTFTASKLIAQNKQGKFTCMSGSIHSEYFAISSRDGYLGFYGYTTTGKGQKELKRIGLNGKTPFCITVVRSGSYLLCGCDQGLVLVFEDYHSIASSAEADKERKRKKTKTKDQGDNLGFSYKIKCSVNLTPIGRSPVVKIMLDLSTCTTVAIGGKNEIAGYATQTILSGKLASSTVENDYGEVSEIQKELSSYTEKANSMCSSHFGSIISMDTCVMQGLVVTCSTDNTVRIWDIDTWNCEVVSYFPTKEEVEAGFEITTILGPPEFVAFHPQGYHVVVSHDESISLFFILHNRLELAHTFPLSHCFKAFFSKGGNLLAGVAGNMIDVFQTAPPYAHYATLKGHLGPISNVCWSSDDLRIASTCVRGSVMQWDMNPSYKAKADRITRSKPEEYIKKIDSFIDVAIDDVEPILKERSVVVISFDGSLQFLKEGNVQHRLATKALEGDRATVVHFTTVTMHYESSLTKDLRMADEFFNKNVLDRPKVGVLLVGTNTGNIMAFTNWRKLHKNPHSRDALDESLLTHTQKHIFPRCHSEPIVSISAMTSESSGYTNKYNTVISCCASGNICVSYMALQEGHGSEDKFTTGGRPDHSKKRLFADAEATQKFVLVPYTLIMNFDAEIKEFKVRVEELATEVDYQRERSAKQQRDTLKVFSEKESTLVTEYKGKTVDLEQALEKAEKTADVKVKALQLKQEETLAVMEDRFESKLHRELEISHTLREEAEDAALKHKDEKARLNNNLQGKYDAMKSKMNGIVNKLQDSHRSLQEAKVKSERHADKLLCETEANYDADLETELLRTRLLEKELRQKIHDANLEARMHKRSYDSLIDKLEREKKEEFDHASEKENLKKTIEDLENECLKFEKLIEEREEQLVEKEQENEELARSNNEKEKQIFLHQELQRDMKERFEPIKERLEVMEENDVLQDVEVEKQFNRLRGQKVQIEDKDRLIRTLRSELNKQLERARILAAKLEEKSYQEEGMPEPKATVPPAQQHQTRERERARQRPQSSPVYSMQGGAQRARMQRRTIQSVEDDEAASAKLYSEMQRQRAVMEKASNSMMKRANYFEERVTEVSEQRAYENRELLDENIKLRKKLKETQRRLQRHEAEALQKTVTTNLKEGATSAMEEEERERVLRRPKSAVVGHRPLSGNLIRGSTSRLIKSVSVADKEKISGLMSELQVSKNKTKEQKDEIKRLKSMVNTYRDERIVGSRSLRPASAPPRRRWK